MQSQQDMVILGEDENTSNNFRLHEDEEFILGKQNIEEDHRNLVSKSSDIGSYARDGL